MIVIIRIIVANTLILFPPLIEPMFYSHFTLILMPIINIHINNHTKVLIGYVVSNISINGIFVISRIHSKTKIILIISIISSIKSIFHCFKYPPSINSFIFFLHDGQRWYFPILHLSCLASTIKRFWGIMFAYTNCCPHPSQVIPLQNILNSPII